MQNKKRIVIIGASSYIAEHCARLWLQDQSAILTLVGRDSRRIERVARDLQVRSPQSEICVALADFLNPEKIALTVKEIFKAGEVDIALIAHGWLPDQTECQNSLDVCRSALEINGLSPVLFAEAFAQEMARTQHGAIVLLGSVAGDRGRQSNYVYGAAKSLVACYAQGMKHRFAGTGVSVLLVKPGPTDTPMTAHLKGQGARLAAVEDVAQRIVDGVKARKSILYAPAKWRLIMLAIRFMPDFIFNKLKI